jgi:transposase
MSSRLLPDELWNEIEPFLPNPEPPSSEGGRPPIENRVVLTCILFVLKTGIAWEDLPLELGCSYKTCKRRLKEWTEAGVWQRFLAHTLTRLRAEDQLELADVLIDAGLVKALLGGQKPARTRRIAASVAASTT